MKKLIVVLLVILFATLLLSTEFYIVKEGDTLSKIAKENGLTVEELVQYNNLENPDLIFVGQKLRLTPKYTQKDLNEQLVMSILWYQNSGEMRALAYQAFNVAKLIYDMDLKEEATQTRAVIVDVDETVLNNSPYDAGHIGTEHAYPVGWTEWCEARLATAIPGAVEFLNYVAKTGGEVFYITNRKENVKQATIDNLKMLGFPFADEEHVLTRTTTSDKEPRRQMVAKKYRIVLLMGDNLNDFSSLFAKKSVEERAALVDKMKEMWGTKFIVLPNPIYGDWEGAIYNYNWGLSPEEKDKARKEHLFMWKYEQ
ncbi:5'-nucleotidase, lipoprotein e(P4) family [Thermosipho atlanticus]|uniref:5'-nucleotidase, lipoprotein e(P4) family n=1 Tax=Thermosipho atlanticus DSM 15807 TaxID=1123380 RepID=A0A1M5TLK5_9BACT|nr:5'-nucleotidase, lipoprotein e(P4) family [Thermosipho atlanticus]SHH51594.1 5'-nucleotidase, lipoprotein e(P4) family [Thermosipho atlanticus DSM 15807]